MAVLDQVADSPQLLVGSAQVGSFATNVYYIFDKVASKVVVIDAPKPVEPIRNLTEGYKPQCILITHGHWDHIDGAEELARMLNVAVGVNRKDTSQGWSTPTLEVEDGARVKIGGTYLECLYTPGHTAGSTSYLLHGKELFGGDFVFVGDTLFPGGPGKTADAAMFQRIVSSITSKLLTLESDCVVLPGHGKPTTIGEAKKEYAFFESRTKPDQLWGDVLWKG